MYCDVSSTRRVAVYCASSFGHHPLYADVAAEFGRILTERNIGLVYGGSGTGTMQSLAEAVLGNGGEAIGVYPAEFPREQLQPGLTRTIEVESLAERKEVMLELADAVVALPGGFGTLDEFFDAFSRFKLGYIRKPCGLLNAGGYYDFLLEFLDRGVDSGLIAKQDREMLLSSDDPAALLDELERVRSESAFRIG